MSHFDFKHFRIRQSNCAMKVGTDGVVLGAWADLEHSRRILDIGTGTGLIALMLAQRSTAFIEGIDIDPAASRQAAENAALSVYSDRINIITSDICHFAPLLPYDTIVSNPPFFQSSLHSENEARTTARHTTELTYKQLIKKSMELLSSSGSFQLILPSSSAGQFIALAISCGFHLLRQTEVITKAGKLPKRTLLHFSKAPTKAQVAYDTLLLYDETNQKTKEYQTLTRDFYL